MRRQRQACRRAAKTLLRDRHKPDSDESISDEDDGVLPNNAPSLDPVNKQELPLPVRLDILKGISNKNLSGKGCSSYSFQKLLEDEVEMPDFNEGHVSGEVAANSIDEEINSADGKLLEDEVEMPDFNAGDVLGEVAANSTDEETNSADEDNTVLSTRRLHKYGPQSIRKKQVKDTTRIPEALLLSKVSASASGATCSKANTSGIWKAKPRFPLPSVSRKCAGTGSSISNIESLPEITEAVDPRISATLDADQFQDDDRIEISSDIEPAETEALQHGFNLTSMDDPFDNLQDKVDQLFQKSSRSHLQETVIEDSPEPVDSGSSSDNEVSDQRMKITYPGKKMQTMAERFEKAFGTSSVITEGTHVGALSSLRSKIAVASWFAYAIKKKEFELILNSVTGYFAKLRRTGIFGKLQQMMLKEKGTDMDFWRMLQAGARPDSELGCIDVKIISRYPDGKLTVCHCSFGKNTESFLLQINAKGTGSGGSASSQSTVIFSSRVCNNIELEVGKLIRIHPPWKEVQVGNDNIMLCTYFSEIFQFDSQ